MLKVKNISKSYPKSDRVVLDGVDLEVAKGESIAIVGPSGVGKSTLLNIIALIDNSDSGEVNFENDNIQKLSEEQKSMFRSEKMGFVFQEHHLLPQLTLFENTLLPILTQKDKSKKIASKERALKLIIQLGLEKVMNQLPGELSIGECQRASLVRALVNKPDILLADEPTGALDEQNANALVDILNELKVEENLSVLMVTHDMKMANKLDKVYILEEGKLSILMQTK